MTDDTQALAILKDATAFKSHVKDVFQSSNWQDSVATLSNDDLKNASVVLLVISHCPSSAPGFGVEPCLILNKRSPQVKQAGDLCCPGGGLNWVMDNLYARLLRFPGAPLGGRRLWTGLQPPDSAIRDKLSAALPVLLAAGLREAWEEMRLNPLRFDFTGMLPEQHLVMFKRVIYPMVGWAAPQPYKPNWEVERVVSITLRDLLNPSHYGRFRLVATNGDTPGEKPLQSAIFPCYVHNGLRGQEFLWGATFRIVQEFLKLVFNFIPPEDTKSPIFERPLDDTYLNGSR